MGVAAAVTGTAALVLGEVLEPIRSVTTAEAVALAVFVQGMLVLITLGVALGMAYFAGLRAERARLNEDGGQAPDHAGSPASLLESDRMVPVLAGGITMFCYWLITSMYLYVLPPTHTQGAPHPDLLPFVEFRLLFGVVYVLLGLGLGGLGGRAPAARILLDRLTTKVAPPVEPPAAPPTLDEPAAPVATAAGSDETPPAAE
jgi:hypothetical protein